MATGKERKQARADRYRERALQAKAGSTAAYRRSEELTKNIPSGQPILVGHHSEKRHRRALECSWNALGKSVELERKADYYAAKAEAAEHNRAIYAEDDDAVENLTERVAALESLQERMKAANRIIKNLKQTQEEKIEALCRLGFERRNAEELFVPNCFGTDRFRRLYDPEQRGQYPAAEKTARKRRPSEEYPTKEYTIGEVRIVENTEANRLQGVFPGKTFRSGTERVKIQRFSLGVDRSVLAVLSERTSEIPYRTNTEK